MLNLILKMINLGHQEKDEMIYLNEVIFFSFSREKLSKNLRVWYSHIPLKNDKILLKNDIIVPKYYTAILSSNSKFLCF